MNIHGDKTALARQNRRLKRMGERGLKRLTVVVHESNAMSLDLLRPHLVNPESAEMLASLVAKTNTATQGPVNVSSVRQLSPFRYAGGKTWLVPELRRWIANLPTRPSVFVEPFAGGAISGLTVAVENLADKVVLCELDPEVAAVWRVVFGNSNVNAEWLFQSILDAKLTEEYVRAVIETEPRAIRAKAFRTIIKNRCQRGGILAPGAGLVKAGENGRGLLSRWYPETLVERMRVLRAVRARVQFVQGDAFDVIAQHADNPTAAFLVDPPYTAGGKSAGSRLYLHNVIDHSKLFVAIEGVQGSALLTYDDTPEVEALAQTHGFDVSRVVMKNTHHSVMNELLIKKFADPAHSAS